MLPVALKKDRRRDVFHIGGGWMAHSFAFSREACDSNSLPHYDGIVCGEQCFYD